METKISDEVSGDYEAIGKEGKRYTVKVFIVLLVLLALLSFGLWRIELWTKEKIAEIKIILGNEGHIRYLAESATPERGERGVGPDLVIRSVRTFPAEPKAGPPFLIHIEIENRGTRIAEPEGWPRERIPVSIRSIDFQEPNNLFPPKYNYVNVFLENLPPGAVRTVTFSDVIAHVPAEYRVEVVVDRNFCPLKECVQDTVKELDESNNEATLLISVS